MYFSNPDVLWTIKNELVKLQNDVAVKVIDHQSKLLDSQARLIEAEVKGQSWLQRNWRPITMITFLFLVVMDSFGLLSFRLSGDAPQCGINVVAIADRAGWLCGWEIWREDFCKAKKLEFGINSSGAAFQEVQNKILEFLSLLYSKNHSQYY